jgi:hypothetical protein
MAGKVITIKQRVVTIVLMMVCFLFYVQRRGWNRKPGTKITFNFMLTPPSNHAQVKNATKFQDA